MPAFLRYRPRNPTPKPPREVTHDADRRRSLHRFCWRSSPCSLHRPVTPITRLAWFTTPTSPNHADRVVTKFEWTNPHSHLFIDVKDNTGKVVSWTLEGYPATVLARTGWKRDETVKIGDTDHHLRMAGTRRIAPGASAAGDPAGRT